MPRADGYDIRKAPNAAPIINRFCGKSIVAVLDYYLEASDTEPTDKQHAAVRSFLQHLRRNLEHMDKHLPPVKEK